MITRDPDTGTRNVGMYRMQIIDAKSTGDALAGPQDGRAAFPPRSRARHSRFEVAVAFGGDPALAYAATAPVPVGIDEWMLTGFSRKPSTTVRCKTVELDVPADSDFVLEGFVDPEDLALRRGPFGDHTGYYARRRFPRFHVTCLTHRNRRRLSGTLVFARPHGGRLAWQGDRAHLSAAASDDLSREIVD